MPTSAWGMPPSAVWSSPRTGMRWPSRGGAPVPQRRRVLQERDQEPWRHTAEELRGFSDLVHAMHAATGPQVPVNEQWYHEPPGIGVAMPFRVVVSLRISTLAGFEGGTKIYINTIDPWTLAQRFVASPAEAAGARCGRGLRHRARVHRAVGVAEVRPGRRSPRSPRESRTPGRRTDTARVERRTHPLSDPERADRTAQVSGAPWSTIFMIRALSRTNRPAWMTRLRRALRVFSVGRGAAPTTRSAAMSGASSRGVGEVSEVTRYELPARAGLGLVDEQVVEHQLEPVPGQPDLTDGVLQTPAGPG